MKPRGPSWGFVYLASVVAACAAFAVFLTGRFWFDEDDPAHRRRGEAQYLWRLANASSGAERWRWMNEALPLCLALADFPRVATILAELGAAGVEPRLDPAAMVLPDTVWAAGLTADGWTTGAQAALLVVRNTAAEPASLVMQWRAAPGAGSARYRRGAGEWQAIAFDTAGTGGLAVLEVALPPSSGFELIAVRADVTRSPGGDPRNLGIHLERAHWSR